MVSYFSVEWKNERANKNSSAILIVDGTRRKITYGELSKRGDVLFQQDGPLQACDSGKFFSNLTEIMEQWGDRVDFSVSLSDDCWWKIKIRAKAGRMYRIKGTTTYPPYGDQIAKELEALCKNAGIHIDRV